MAYETFQIDKKINKVYKLEKKVTKKREKKVTKKRTKKRMFLNFLEYFIYY